MGGAGPTWKGVSGIHTHCTNTRITDPEILERRYPVLLHQFSIRTGSGGDGVIRELEPLRPLTMSILSERRVLAPYGMNGGQPGKPGRNLLLRPNNNNNTDNDGSSSSSFLEVNIGGR